MASPNRTTVTIDGQKFQAVTTSVKFNTAKDRAGVAQMGSLATKIRVLGRSSRRPEPAVQHGQALLRPG